MSEKPTRYAVHLTINENSIALVLIGRHYLLKHGSYMNNGLILDLVTALDKQTFRADSVTDGIQYFVADVKTPSSEKKYRIIWLFEGEKLEVLGVVNAYRKKKK